MNKEKCFFGLKQIEILGHVVTADGIKTDPQKIEAVCNAPRPKNVSQFRSFLGTCGFLMKFVPNYANLSEPLIKLSRQGQEWQWSSEAENANFQFLKKELVSEPCLAYFNINAPTFVISDASPVGLGAVFLQTQDGAKKPVAYASRSLTPTEQRYSQIEQEALGCVWAVEHFRAYLWGGRFTLQTDHRPLIYMLNPEKSKLLPPKNTKTRTETVFIQLQD